MSSKSINDSLRGFRKKDDSDAKKQSSILRFIRRDPATDSASDDGTSSSLVFIDDPTKNKAPAPSPSAAMSPKISTIVVRKPSSVVSIRSNAASTTAKAFSAFNSSKLHSGKPGAAVSNGNSAVDGSSEGTDAAQEPSRTSEGKGGSDDDSSQGSPILRVKVVNNRILDSDEDDEAPPTKKFRLDPYSADNVDKLLCQSFDEEPVELIDNYLDTLTTMFPDYDKMELQDALRKFRYNFSETSAHLEEEERLLREEKRRQGLEERMDKINQRVSKQEELNKKDEERLSIVQQKKQLLSSTEDSETLLSLEAVEQELQQRLQKRLSAKNKLHLMLEKGDHLRHKLMETDQDTSSSSVNGTAEVAVSANGGAQVSLSGNSAGALTANGGATQNIDTKELRKQLDGLRQAELAKRKEEYERKNLERQKLTERRDAMLKLHKEREQEHQNLQKETEEDDRFKISLQNQLAKLKEVQLQKKKKEDELKQQMDEAEKAKQNSSKFIAKQKMQDKKKMYKLIGASSRFNQLEEDDEEDVYIGKSNVYISDDSECEDEGGGEVSAEIRNMRTTVLNFLNTASEQEICGIPGCTKKKGEIIAALKPFSDWDHLVSCFKREKYIAPDLLNNVKNVLQKRSTVLQLMKRCESIASEIQNSVTLLMDGDEAEAAISKQPSLLNPEMQLKGYQMIGLNWLVLMQQHGLNGVLADEMGLGKTVQAIAYLAYVTETLKPEDLSLIVVPSSTLENWARELEVWCPSLGVLMYHGSQEERRGMRIQIFNGQIDENINILLTTYNTMYSCAEDRTLFKRMKIHTVIFDEAHMLKNMNTSRFENLMRINAECRLLLTGTPLQNNLVELMSILVFVMPQLFEGRKEELKQVFAMFPRNDERDKSQYESKRIEQAKRIMKPFFLRRLKNDVLKDLPAKHDRIETIEMAEKQLGLYKSVVDMLSKRAQQMQKGLNEVAAEKLTELEELQASQESFGVRDKKKKEDGEEENKPEDSSSNMLMTLRRISNHPLLYRKNYDDTKIQEMARVLKRTSHRESILQYIVEDFSVMSDFEIHTTCKSLPAIDNYKLDDSAILDSGKFVKFDQLLPEMKTRGDRVLIFSQFVIVLNIIEEYMRIRGHRFLRLDGSTPVTERQELIDEYNEDQDIFVFLLSTRAGGLGINLTSANTVILHDIDFNPYNDKQAEDRCHRVGQTRPVNVIRFITKESIEEGILSIAQSKLALEREVTGMKDEQHKKVDVLSLLQMALGINKSE